MIKRSLLPILTFAKIDIKRLFRDKVGIFFVFIFPLIFLLVFGGLFGQDSGVSFNIALINQSESEFAQDFTEQLEENEIFKVSEEVTDIDTAQEEMSRGTIDALVVLTSGFGAIRPSDGSPSGQVEVTYDKGNEQAGVALGSILESIFADINAELVPIETPFSVATAPTAREGLTSLDYIFSGLLGFTILSLGIFGPTTVFPRMKEKGILRRYQTTPIKVWQYFAGNVLSNAAVGVMAIGVMFTTALLFFNVSMRGDYISLVLLAILGTIVLFGVGLAAGGWAKNENQAAPLANLIAFPMMFLSGVFFPRFLMPEWLQTVSGFFPLTPLVDGLRLIITEGRTILELGLEVGLLAVWAVVIYAIAFRVFRWE
ncbi:MAG: ABC transporter permease [Candidatus Saccharimonadales bacterium]